MFTTLPMKEIQETLQTYRFLIAAIWVDILLLELYSILFFTASFVSFLRYNVR